MPRKSTASGKSQPPDGLRVRNAGLRRVRVADLADAPWNHRTHPQAQAAALDGAIDELGFYGFPDVFEAPDGTLMLIDGHLRKERLIAKYGADAEIEVNVTDFDEAEAKKANLTKDPLAAMAEQSAEKLDLLLRETETANEALAQMLTDLAEHNGIIPAETDLPNINETTRHTVVVPYSDAEIPILCEFLGVDTLPSKLGKAINERIKELATATNS